MLQILNFFLIVAFSSKMAQAQNLTAITWDHAVNSQAKLQVALNSTSLDFIEADIVLGTVSSDPSREIPIMGHPPANTSDLSFDSFLNQIINFNNETKSKKKGVKLDFKSTQVFTAAITILTANKSKLTFPVWLNADIIPGPVNNTETVPVGPDAFFTGAKSFNTSVLSIGWTTQWGSNYTEGNYTEQQINDMITAINRNGINVTGQEITFPVRAGIAANSLTQLQNLQNIVSKTNPTTFTVWSSENDSVNIEKLNDFIIKIGVNKVYLDVPTEVSNKLNLGSGSNALKMNFSLLGLLFLCFQLIKNLVF